MVDARDLKSLGPGGCAGSSPAPGTMKRCFSEKINIFHNFYLIFIKTTDISKKIN
jgi:hypothetical protein